MIHTQSEACSLGRCSLWYPKRSSHNRTVVQCGTGKLNPHSTSISCIQSKALHVPRSDIPLRTQPSIRRTCTKPN